MTEQITMAITAPSSEGAREKHHAYGPSKWPALLECPCFEGRPATADTQCGTDLHALFESVLRGEYDGEPKDAMEYHVVNAALDFLRTAKPVDGFHIEETVKLPAPPQNGPDDEIFGRLDLGWIQDGETVDLHIVDLKMAENPDRDPRAQELGYAFGLARSAATPLEPERIILHTVYADTGDVTQDVIWADEAWKEYEANYVRIANIVHGLVPAKPRQCGWCTLCAHHESCQAPRAVAETVAEGALADAPEHWAEFTSARKAQLCALADTVAKWAGAIKALAGDDAKAGQAIEDPENGIYYAVQERKGRLDLDTQTAWEAVKDRLTADGFKACLSVAASKLKDALKAVGMKAKEADALLESAGTRGPSTLVFVRKGVRG